MTQDFIHASVTVNLRNTTRGACQMGVASQRMAFERGRAILCSSLVWTSVKFHYLKPLKQSDRKRMLFSNILSFLFSSLCFLLIITWYLVVIELICHAMTRVFANCVPRNCEQYYHDKCLVLSWQRRRQTLCDKRDNNFAWKKLSSKLHPPLKELSVEDQNTLRFSEDHDKRRRSPVTFVTHKRFAVLFFLPSCWVNSLMFTGKPRMVGKEVRYT